MTTCKVASAPAGEFDQLHPAVLQEGCPQLGAEGRLRLRQERLVLHRRHVERREGEAPLRAELVIGAGAQQPERGQRPAAGGGEPEAHGGDQKNRKRLCFGVPGWAAALAFASTSFSRSRARFATSEFGYEVIASL